MIHAVGNSGASQRIEVVANQPLLSTLGGLVPGTLCPFFRTAAAGHHVGHRCVRRSHPPANAELTRHLQTNPWPANIDSNLRRAR